MAISKHIPNWINTFKYSNCSSAAGRGENSRLLVAMKGGYNVLVTDCDTQKRDLRS